MLTLDQLKLTHTAYPEVVERADYLYRSYIGGETYREGNYLTQYYGEDSGQYQKRLDATPLNNYVKTTVDIYRSFLFRELPSRTTAGLERNPLFQQWMQDADQDGQGMDSFMKSINDMAMVTGNVWLLVDKPAYQVETSAQEIALGIRPYICAYASQNVLDWEYERGINGKRELTMIKVVESNNNYNAKITVWYPDRIEKYVVGKDAGGEFDAVIDQQDFTNPLGYIPFVNYAPLPSPTRGVGYSLVEDVADIQKYIYNLTSEAEQTIRISGHPTLVKTTETNATAGAGSIVNMPNDTDPGLVPFLLQPTGATVGSILDSIDKNVDAILRMTHTSAVQATKNAPQSGVALQTERALLNAKLSDISDTLQETEYKLHRIWADWQNITLPADFAVNYSDTFDMRDHHVDAELYRKLLEINPHDSFAHYVHDLTVDMVVEKVEKAQEIKDQIAADHEQMMMAPPVDTQE